MIMHRLFWSSVTLFALVVTAVAAEITLKATPSRPNIYLGESFNLTVELSGADQKVGEPDLSALQAAEVQFLGQHSNSRTSISIINGRMTRDVHEGRVYSYQIKPKVEGAFRAGPVHVTVGGKRHSASGGLVQVKGIEKQDVVVAAVNASSTTVLVEEPFEVVVTVAVAELPEPYAANNEPLHPQQLPQITADFLEIREDIKGLKGPDLNQFLNSLVDQSGQQPSFAINNYQARDFGGFGSLFGDGDPFKPRPIRFRLEPQRIVIDGKNYRQYSLKLNYTANQEGEYIFGPLTFKGSVMAGVTQERQPVMRDIYTIGPAATVRVVPPPDEGRPEWFVGAVGKELKAVATLDTMVCKVGDPLTLTLEITGAISISNLRAPLLSLQPELSRDFRIYDDNISTDTLLNGKRFKYRVRPTREGTLEFPPVKIAYYDTALQSYKNVTTEPVPLQARATTQIATLDNGEGEDMDAGLTARTTPLPCAITLNARGAANDALRPAMRDTLLLLLVAPLLCLFALLMRPLATALANLRSHNRRSAALRQALSALTRAKTPQAASEAVRGYLTERFDAHGDSLTPAEAVGTMRLHQVTAKAAQEVGTLLGQLDEMLYRPDAQTSIEGVTARLRTILREVDKELKTQVRVAAAREVEW